MASGIVIDDLPDEMLLEIFSYFTTEQLATTAQHVSCHWKEVSQDNSLWKNRGYSPETTTTDDEIVQHLKNMPLLKKFSPKRGLRTKKIIDTICKNCRNIEHLEFYENQTIKPHTLKQIVKAFPDLTVLHVPLCNNVDLKFFTDIGKLKKLTTLDFMKHYVYIDKNVLSTLADECLSLQHIHLGCCEFDDQDMRHFLEKKRYQLLSFSIQCYISSLTHNALTECANLEYLSYEDRNIDLPDVYVHQFSKLSKLKKLSFYYCREEYMRNLGSIFTNNALLHLISLEISWCYNLQAETLNEIFKNCPGLKEFKLCDRADFQVGFESISNCRKLEKLALECSELVAKNFEYIADGCHELKYLYIGSCGKVTDKKIEQICIGCPLLEHLELHSLWKLTDRAIKQLLKCKNLRFINITDNDNITGVQLIDIPTYLVHFHTLKFANCIKFNKEIIGKLQTKMPHFRIEYDIECKENESYSDTDLEDVSLLN